MTIRELPHNEHLLILGKCDGQNIAPAFDEFTSGYKEKENTTVNQIVTKRTAHPPSFEISQMCSMICRRLIFKGLKNRVHHEVNSFNNALSLAPTQCLLSVA